MDHTSSSSASALAALESRFGAWPRSAVVVLALGLAGLFGMLDHVTGYEFSFSIFYLVPIALASWFGGRRAGLLLCFASVAIWFTVDTTSGHVYSVPAVRFWNAGVRLGFFVVTSSLLASLHTHLRAEERLARFDGLTGMLNGRAFRESCAGLIELAARHRRPLALGYVDLDDFKVVNDKLGHAEGDRVLQGVAQEIVSRLRETDVVGRLGGDEFAILLPATDGEGAETLFAGVRARLAERIAREGWPVGLSVGVVAFEGEIPTLHEALHEADALMYEVKRGGKNRVAVRHQSGEIRVA